MEQKSTKPHLTESNAKVLTGEKLKAQKNIPEKIIIFDYDGTLVAFDLKNVDFSVGDVQAEKYLIGGDKTKKRLKDLHESGYVMYIATHASLKGAEEKRKFLEEKGIAQYFTKIISVSKGQDSCKSDVISKLITTTDGQCPPGDFHFIDDSEEIINGLQELQNLDELSHNVTLYHVEINQQQKTQQENADALSKILETIHQQGISLEEGAQNPHLRGMQQAGEQDLTADQVKPTGGQLVHAQQYQLIEDTQRNDALELKIDEPAETQGGIVTAADAVGESEHPDGINFEGANQEISLEPSIFDDLHQKSCFFLHKSSKWYERQHYSLKVLEEAADKNMIKKEQRGEQTYQTQIKTVLKEFYIEKLGINDLDGDDGKFKQLCEEIIDQALRLYSMGKSDKPKSIIDGLEKTIELISSGRSGRSGRSERSERLESEAKSETYDTFNALREICEAEKNGNEGKALHDAIHTKRHGFFFNPGSSASAKAVHQKIDQLEDKEGTSCCLFSRLTQASH